MRPILLKTLKILALQGATRHSVHISSTDLGKKLEISQQSASRHILIWHKRDILKKNMHKVDRLLILTKKVLQH